MLAIIMGLNLTTACIHLSASMSNIPLGTMFEAECLTGVLIVI